MGAELWDVGGEEGEEGGGECDGLLLGATGGGFAVGTENK